MSEYAQSVKKKKSEERKKSEMIYVRVDPYEKAEFKMKAEAEGLTVASFIRVSILDRTNTKSRTSPPLDRVLLGRIVGQLGNVSENIKQIAHTLNGNGNIVEEHIVNTCLELTTLRNEILKAIRILDK
jgi:hypothetical protein